jgi:cysteine desulfurase
MRLMVEEFGNAGSRTHTYGAAAQREVNSARERIAPTLAASPEEIIFTSGATESDNLAILGLAEAGLESGRRHIVTTAIEHKAVLEPIEHLKTRGFDVTMVRPDRLGHIAAEELLGVVRPDTLLISVMHANNETGALQPVGAIAEGLESFGDGEGPYFHVDAAQSYGKETGELRHTRIDLISISGHKVFAPKGVGALVARRRRGRRPPLRPLMHGGGQERGLRPGTLPVPLIAGLGLAAELAEAERVERTRACREIRTAALEAFAPLAPIVHADPSRVLSNILSIAFPGLDAEALMVALKDVAAVSNGSACTSERYSPSHVLEAMDLPSEVVAGTIRMSWSHATPAVPWERIADAIALLA